MPTRSARLSKVKGALRWGLLVSASCVALAGCKSQQDSSAKSEVTPDRLKPDEPLVNTVEAFGIPMPRELKVQSRFPESVHLAGRAKVSDLTEYFREYVVVDHLEMSDSQTVFPHAHLKGKQDGRSYRITLTDQGSGRSQVIVEDVTPPPVTPGLTEAQRWEQVGMNPDGTLKDRLHLK
jgi:hypothetical protein